MASSCTLQQEICIEICIWFVIVHGAMIYAIWTNRQSEPSRQRQSPAQRQAADASVNGRPTLVRQFAADAERRRAGNDIGAVPPDRGEESALDPPVTTCHNCQDPCFPIKESEPTSGCRQRTSTY
jgi:hypothetical protein